MISKHIIYVLSDPRTREIRYIGRTQGGETQGTLRVRLREHINDSYARYSNPEKYKWIEELLKAGLEPLIEPLEECLDRDTANELETLWIRRFLGLNANLLNIQKAKKRKR